MDQAPIRVLVVDDHPLIREGLRVFLRTRGDMVLVGEAACGEEALDLCGTVQPDVVLMDLKMPGLDGLECTRAIRARYPKVQVVVLTSYSEAALVQDALRAGVTGYLVKDAGADDLARAIRAAFSGKTFLSPRVAEALVQVTRQSRPVGRDLTRREREVLALLADGLTNDAIAKRLTISRSTAAYHVCNILSKLGAENRTEAALLAVQQHILGQE